ncbi:hypothetical protein [Candidatus Poriferisodalis sp.]|uniref:hypothetical protein n=1 Tax=Candidatus Poriferisodalis sp. TaxID=3101277 RepID=UPI003B019F12
MFRPAKPHTPTDDELVQAAANALGCDGDEPEMLVRAAVGAADAVFESYHWLYDLLLHPLLRLAADSATAVGLQVVGATLDPAYHGESRSLRAYAGDQAVTHFEAHHTIIDALTGDLTDAVEHGARAALQRHLNAAARSADRVSAMSSRADSSPGGPVTIPARFDDGIPAAARGKVSLPSQLTGSGHGIFDGIFDLGDPAERQRAYEILLAEGTADDIRFYVDWHHLLDAWEDMSLAEHVRDAWSRYMRSRGPHAPRHQASRRFADALRADGLSVVAQLPPGAVDPVAVERCRAGGAAGLAISPLSHWNPERRDPAADDSLDGVHDATRTGLPILRCGNVDSAHDARLTRMLGLHSTLVSLDTACATAAREIRDAAWSEGTDIAAEVRNEAQIDIAAAIGASVIVVNCEDPDRTLEIGSDLAQLTGRAVAAAAVPAAADARARFWDLADAGYAAAVIRIDPGEDALEVLDTLAGRSG